MKQSISPFRLVLTLAFVCSFLLSSSLCLQVEINESLLKNLLMREQAFIQTVIDSHFEAESSYYRLTLDYDTLKVLEGTRNDTQTPAMDSFDIQIRGSMVSAIYRPVEFIATFHQKLVDAKPW
jgi:hypothetical protein